MPVFFFNKKLTFFLVVGDLLILNSLYYFCTSIFIRLIPTIPYDSAVVPYLVVSLSWSIIAVFTNLYKNSYRKDATDHFSNFSRAFFIFGVFMVLYIRLLYINQNILSLCLSYLGYTFAVLGIWRTVLFLYRKKYRRTLNSNFSTVLIGNSKHTQKILDNSYTLSTLGVRGFYSAENFENQSSYLGDIDSLFAEMKRGKVDSVVFCDDSLSRTVYEDLLDLADEKMVRVYFVPEFRYIKDETVDLIQRVPFINLMAEPMAHPENLFLKRVFDIVFSSLVVIFVLSWLTPVVALLIKLESRGPVFFVQKRGGLKNKTFDCIKFRSMHMNDDCNNATTTKNDSRVTKIGVFLRKTSIDELPQFINVLLGDMSVIGPRPHMISQNNIYSKMMRKYMLRHVIKPGITGWAQVTGCRGEICEDADMKRRIEKDIWYIKNWSFFLDLKIIFLTFYNIIRGDEQAY